MRSHPKIWFFGLALGLAGTAPVAAQGMAPLPVTVRRPISEQYHGVTVTEDYRWLESFDDPAVRAWSDSQNAHTRAVLDGLPARAGIARRVRQLLATTSASYWDLERHGPRLFALK
ncbi:MAG: S9 family peptidase, partial [Gemmatimonadetes bacterium]